MASEGKREATICGVSLIMDGWGRLNVETSVIPPKTLEEVLSNGASEEALAVIEDLLQAYNQYLSYYYEFLDSVQSDDLFNMNPVDKEDDDEGVHLQE